LGGAFLFGPIGFLLGAADSGDVVVGCLACGHQWKPALQRKPKRKGKARKQGCLGCLAVILLGFFLMLLLIPAFEAARKTQDKAGKKQASLPKPPPAARPNTPHSLQPRDRTENRSQVSKAESSDQPAGVVFDVPALVGKNIDQIRTTLGPSDDPQTQEPNDETVNRWRLQTSLGHEADQDEWANSFTRNERDLLFITFNSRTREVKDLFLGGDHAAATNPDSRGAVKTLMQKGNLSADDPRYRVQAVKARNAPGITGITITPTGVGALPARSQPSDLDSAEIDTARQRVWKVWKDAEDKYEEIEATFITAGKGVVTLERKDGSTMKVRLERLSPVDQDFVKQNPWTPR
jgi:hypothetical protein